MLIEFVHIIEVNEHHHMKSWWRLDRDAVTFTVLKKCHFIKYRLWENGISSIRKRFTAILNRTLFPEG